MTADGESSGSIEALPQGILTRPQSPALPLQWLIDGGRLAWRIVTSGPVKDSLVAVFLLAAALVLFIDALRDGLVFYEGDTAAFYYPLLKWVSERIQQGDFPLWTPYIFGGFPIFADGETGILYPPNLLAMRFLSPESALIWLRVARFFMAAIFTYAYCRAIGLSRVGGVVAALVFAFGSFMVGQLHHANIGSSAVWLPLVLFFLEMGLRSTGVRRLRYLSAGGATMGIQALGVHVQPVLMSGLIVVPYIVFRIGLGPVAGERALPVRRSGEEIVSRLLRAAGDAGLHLVRRSGLLAAALATVSLVGIALAAVQLLPLYELSSFAVRGGGVNYVFATTYTLVPYNLISLLFPYFFRISPFNWWTLWAPWEVTVYIGIAPLALAVVAALWVRSRYILFFAALAAAGLLLSLGPNAPYEPFHYLWQLPGFNFLRAPGRYAYLFVFAGAILAGFGTQWLESHLNSARTYASTSFALFLVIFNTLTLGLVLGVVHLRGWLLDNRTEAIEQITTRYLSFPRDNRVLTADKVYDSLLQSLDLANQRTLVSIGLLVATASLLILWFGIKRPGWLWRTLLVFLVAGDLLYFALDFHPKMPADQLSTPPAAVSFLQQDKSIYRVSGASNYPKLQPNRLVPFGIQTFGGYSSLYPTRLSEYSSMMHQYDSTLLDLAGVKYVVEQNQFSSLPSYAFTSFNPRLPTINGVRTNPNSQASFTASPAFHSNAIGIVSAMGNALNIPQDGAVAEITVSDETGGQQKVVLRAGVDTAEWAYARADVWDRVKHKKPTSAFAVWQKDRDAKEYIAQLYYSEIPLKPAVVKKVEFRFTSPEGSVKVYGLTLLDTAKGQYQQLTRRDKYSVAYADENISVYQNNSVLPRAFLVGKATIGQPGADILMEMTEGDFNPRDTVILENEGPFPPQLLEPAVPGERGAGKAEVVRYGTDEVVIEAEADRDAYLVLADSYYPGWRARVDGEAATIYRANYLFRAVFVPQGRHTIEFRFEPPLVRLGAWVSALTGLGIAGLWLYPLVGLVLSFGLWRKSARALVDLIRRFK